MILRLHHNLHHYVDFKFLALSWNYNNWIWSKSEEGSALCYHGILQCVVSKRLFCSFGSELRLQLLILHHHHIDPLFHPLQLVLTSGRRTDKEMWKQKRRKRLLTFACEHTLHNLTSASRCWMYSDWLWLIGTRSLERWILDLSCFFTEESQMNSCLTNLPLFISWWVLMV